MNFQPPSKSLTSRDYQFIALVIVLLLALSTFLINLNLKLKGGGDFYVHWVASRGFVFDQIDPYSGEVSARVQQLAYEGPAQIGDEPFILDTPFHILLLYFPISLLPDPHLARAIYTLFLELALFVLAILSLRLTDWEVPRVFAILFVFIAIFNYYAFQAVYEASPVILLGLLYAEILLTLRVEEDELAGALLAVSFYYWEVGAPFIFLVALRCYYEKRTRVFSGFFMAGLVLAIISFLAYPNWIIPFLRATTNNLRADFGYSIRSVLTHFLPSQGGFVSWALIVTLLIALIYEWSLARKGDLRRFYWSACLSLAAAPLLGFRTEMEHLSILVIPLALIFAIVHNRWYKFGNVLTLLLLTLVFLIPWAAYIFILPRFGKIALDLIFFFLPFFTVIGLYWIRWWALRPPRTWQDLANQL